MERKADYVIHPSSGELPFTITTGEQVPDVFLTPEVAAKLREVKVCSLIDRELDAEIRKHEIRGLATRLRKAANEAMIDLRVREVLDSVRAHVGDESYLEVGGLFVVDTENGALIGGYRE